MRGVFILKFKDVRFRCFDEYDPKSRFADKNGNVKFWIAEILINDEYDWICYAHTKAECEKEARRLVKEETELIINILARLDRDLQNAHIYAKESKRNHEISAMRVWDNEALRIQNKIEVLNKMLNPKKQQNLAYRSWYGAKLTGGG